MAQSRNREDRHAKLQTRIALLSLIVAVIIGLGSFVVPEIRKILGLDATSTTVSPITVTPSVPKAASDTPLAISAPTSFPTSAKLTGVQVVYSHDFSDKALPIQWQWQGEGPSPRIDNGQLIIEGNNSWNNVSQANFGQDDGALVLFKYNKSIRGLSMSFDTGSWDTNSVLRWNFVHWGPSTWELQAFKNGSVIVENYGTIELAQEAWYYLLLRIGRDGRFYAQVWPYDNPSAFDTNISSSPEDGAWKNRNWRFQISIYDGSVTVQSFQKLRFPENHKMPDLPANR
jgi:hypothetical protein